MNKINVFWFAFFLSIDMIYSQANITHTYDNLNRHTKTITSIDDAIMIDSFEYDKVGAMTRHLRYSEAPDLRISQVEWEGVSYGPNTLPLLPNVVGRLEITHENVGLQPASRFTIEVRWSADNIWDNNDLFLYDVTAPSLGTGVNNVRTETNSTFFLSSNIPAGAGYLLFYTDHSEEVTESDETNNLYAVPLYVCTPYALSTLGVDDYCNNATGTATVSTTGTSPPYSYVWSQGSTGTSVNNLQGSIGGQAYSVTATDANGCTATTPVTISSNAPVGVSLLSTTTAYCGSNTGFIAVQAQGGTGSYNYMWSTGQTTPVGQLGNLTAGGYTVTATDAQGCTATASATVVGSSALVINSNNTATTCGNNNGSINLNVSGGLGGNYNYTWSTGNTVPNLSNLASGSYQVTVSDGTCQSNATILVGASTAPSLNIQTQATDCSQQTGRITTTTSGGTAPLSYGWNTGATTSNLDSLAAGTYSLTLTDGNNCVANQTVTITTTNSLAVNTNILDANCNLPTGNIQALVTGGSGSYHYAWSTGASSNTATGLVQGIYTVTITDSSAPQTCLFIHQDTVQGSPPIALALQAFAADTCAYGTASATVAAIGGTTPFRFLWNNGASTLAIDSLSAGSYGVTVSDANGCIADTTLFIPAVRFAPNVAPFPPVLSGGVCVLQVAEASNALFLPYRYAWSNGDTTNPANGLPNIAYTVTITNSIGCDTILNIDCSTIDFPTISNDFDLQVFPNPNNTSTFSVSIQGGIIKSYKIYTIIGQQLMDEVVSVTSGKTQRFPHRINVPGTYTFIFEVEVAGKTYWVDKKIIRSDY